MANVRTRLLTLSEFLNFNVLLVRLIIVFDFHTLGINQRRAHSILAHYVSHETKRIDQCHTFYVAVVILWRIYVLGPKHNGALFITGLDVLALSFAKGSTLMHLLLFAAALSLFIALESSWIIWLSTLGVMRHVLLLTEATPGTAIYESQLSMRAPFVDASNEKR